MDIVQFDGLTVPPMTIRNPMSSLRLAGSRLRRRVTVNSGSSSAQLPPRMTRFGPMAGLGAEYKLDRDLAVTLRTRFGPEFAVVNGGSTGELAFQTLLGVAYNTR